MSTPDEDKYIIHELVQAFKDHRMFDSVIHVPLLLKNAEDEVQDQALREFCFTNWGTISDVGEYGVNKVIQTRNGDAIFSFRTFQYPPFGVYAALKARGVIVIAEFTTEEVDGCYGTWEDGTCITMP
jgi:hypothetical protein